MNAQTGTTYTVQNGDCGKLVTHTNGSAIAVTLPQANGSTFIAGWFVDVQNRGAGTVTIAPTTSTIDGAATLVLTTQQGARIVSDGTNYFSQRGGAGSSAGATSGYGTYASLPGTCATGDLYSASDWPAQAVCTATNTWKWRWQNYNVTPPPTCASLTLINAGGQTSNTCTNTGGALILNTTGNAAFLQAYLAVQSAPGSTPYSFTTRYNFSARYATTDGRTWSGICFRNSSSGKAHCAGFYNNGIVVINLASATSWTSYLITYSSLLPSAVLGNSGTITFKIVNDGTNRDYNYSTDGGLSYVKYWTELNNVDFTADQVGFLVANWDVAGSSVIATFWDWTQGTN